MVAVMTMTPIHVRLHGNEAQPVRHLYSHAGMYEFSPIIARFADRRSRLPAVRTRRGRAVVAAVLAALAGDAQWLMFWASWRSDLVGTSA